MDDLDSAIEQTLKTNDKARLGAVAVDPLDSAVDNVLSLEKTRQRATLQTAVKVNPDEAARANALAAKKQLPPDMVLRNLPQVQQQAATDEAEVFIATSPALATKMRELPFAQVAHDNVPNLAAIEKHMQVTGEARAWNGPEPTLGSYLSGVWQSVVGRAKQADIGLSMQFGDLLDKMGFAPDPERQRELRRRYAQANSDVAMATPNFETDTSKAIFGGVSSTAAQVAPLALSVAMRNPSIVLGTMGVQTEAEAYGKYRERGATPGQALLGGVGEGAVEVITEKIPMGFLVDKFGKTGAKQFISGMLLREIPSEQIATIAQDAIDTAIANPGKTWEEYLQERPGAAYQTLVATLTQTALTGGTSAAVQKLAARAQKEQAVAERDANALGGLLTLAEKDKLRERDPASFASMVQAAAQQHGAPTEVYIDARALADTLAQGGMTPEQIEAALPSAKIGEAYTAGGDVVVPVGEFTALVAGSGFEQQLLKHTRLSPDALSQEDAKLLAQIDLKAEGAKVAEAADAELTRQATSVRSQVLAQLNEAGRFSPAVNEANADAVGAFFDTMASRLGVTPEALFEQYPLKVKAEITPGASLDQRALPDGVTIRELPDGNGFEAINAKGERVGYLKDNLLRGQAAQIDESANIDIVKVSDSVKGQGVGSALYAAFNEKHGGRIAPSGKTTADAWAVWKRNYPEKVKQFVRQEAARIKDGASSELVLGNITDADVRGQVADAVAGRVLNQGPADARGAFTPSTNTIALLAKADLSTFLHETGHFYLEVLADLASQPNAPADIVADMQKVLEWFGLPSGRVGGPFQAVVDRLQLNAEKLGNLAVGEAGVAQAGGPFSAESLGGVLRDVALAVDDPQVLRSVVGALPVDVVNMLRREQLTPEDALHDPTVLQQVFAVDATHDVSVAVNRSRALVTLLRETARAAAEATGRPADLGGRAVADSAAAKAGDGGHDSDSIRGEGQKAISRWRSLTIDQQRKFHEQFARGFEAFLFEGKSPSTALARVFSRFRSWLVNIYRNIRALNVELNDDIRGVFDRLLATEEAIKEAEAARAYAPLFADEKALDEAGVDPASYQALGAEATAEAVDSLSARSMRDMRWLANAKSRALKALQKDAAEKRKAIETQVRDEVGRMPVYAAENFLRRGVLPGEPAVLTKAVGKDGKPMLVYHGTTEDFDSFKGGMFTSLRARAENYAEGSKGRVLEAYLDIRKPMPWQDAFGKSPDEIKAAGFDGTIQWGNDGGIMRAVVVSPEQVIKTNGKEGFNNAQRKALDATQGMNVKLDLATLKAMYGEDPAAPWRYLQTGKTGLAGNGGVHPDIVAEIFGFPSGDALVRELLAAESQAQVIEGRTDQRMLEENGEIASPEALERAAEMAIRNEARGRFIATELAALDKAVGPVRVIVKAAKEFAERIIGTKTPAEIKPHVFAAAETRAARLAEKSIGKVEEAAQAKRNQLLNHYAARYAYEAQEEIRRIREFFAKVANTPDDRLKSRDIDVVNAARVVLAAYGVGRRGEAAADYMRRVSAYDPEMAGVLQGVVDAAMQQAKPIDELTFDELRALNDEVASLWHLAKRSRQMEVDGNLLDREEVQDELKARNEAIGIPDKMPGDTSAITPTEERLAKLKTYLASARRTEGWVGAMDGGDSGPYRRFVWQPVKEAADAYRADKARLLKKFRELLKPIAPTLKKRLIDAPELGYTFGKDTGGVAMNEILHAIAHTGNESNKRKLLLGRKWATELEDGTLDTSRWDRFVNRLAAEGVLKKEHFDFVQGVWDLLEETKPLAQKTHRDVFGKYFAEITAETLNTPFGQYRGGYVPAQADPRVVSDAQTRKLMEEENASMAFAFPTTNKGFTKGRVEYNRPLMLDLGTLAQHIDKVLLFGHMERPIRDVRRVLTSKDVAYGVNRIDTAAFDAIISPWLNRAARQQVTTPTPGHWQSWRLWSTLRNRAGMAAMFGNVVNAAQQITGFSIAAVKVRPKYLLGAMADYVKAPREMSQTVAEASPYMEGRMRNEVSAMNDQIKDILIDPSLYERSQQWAMRHAYFLQSAVDNVMSPVIWTGAYNQAIEQGQSEKDAIRFADSTVRQTQGSTLPEDISNFEAGSSFSRMFTQFAGYFNMQANLLGTELQTISRDMGLRKGAGKGLYVLALGFLVPAWISELIVQAARGGPDDEDKDGEYLDDWLAAVFGMSTLRGITAMIPIFGQGINAIGNAMNSKPYDDRLATSPAISMIEGAVRAPVDVYKAAFEDGDKSKAVKDVASLISLTTGIPANIAARPLSYAVDVQEGDVVPTSSADAVRGLVTGRASPDSKR